MIGLFISISFIIMFADEYIKNREFRTKVNNLIKEQCDG